MCYLFIHMWYTCSNHHINVLSLKIIGSLSAAGPAIWKFVFFLCIQGPVSTTYNEKLSLLIVQKELKRVLDTSSKTMLPPELKLLQKEGCTQCNCIHPVTNYCQAQHCCSLQTLHVSIENNHHPFFYKILKTW